MCTQGTIISQVGLATEPARGTASNPLILKREIPPLNSIHQSAFWISIYSNTIVVNYHYIILPKCNSSAYQSETWHDDNFYLLVLYCHIYEKRVYLWLVLWKHFIVPVIVYKCEPCFSVTCNIWYFFSGKSRFLLWEYAGWVLESFLTGTLW